MKKGLFCFTSCNYFSIVGCALFDFKQYLSNSFRERHPEKSEVINEKKEGIGKIKVSLHSEKDQPFKSNEINLHLFTIGSFTGT